MGWFERLSGSDKPEGARNASVAEEVEIKRYRAHHPPLKSDEALRWEGHLLTGYHLHKVRKGASTEYVTADLPSRSAKINY
ncbi:MAG: hypothetical protein ACRDRI_16125 [Pseudonocardiaceae bacterium]